MMQYGNRWVKRTAVVLMLLTLLALPLLHIYAADAAQSVAQENQEARFRAEGELNALIMAYQAMEENPDSERWVGVERAITQYGNSKLTALVSDERYQTDPLTVEIQRYQAMGTVAGEVAWIYYTHVIDLPADRKAAVTEAYQAILKDIDAVTLESQTGLTRTYLAGGFCARMYVAIYNEKLDALLLDRDSEAVKAKVVAAKADLTADACVPVTIEGQVCTSGALYQVILEKTTKAVAVQRNQELAMEQLTGAFAVIRPDASAETHAGLIASLAALDADTTEAVADINRLLGEGFFFLLDEFEATKDGYLDTYFTGLKQTVTTILAEADAAGQVAVIMPVLDGHEIKYLRAVAKDSLVAYVAECDLTDDPDMQTLLNRYNGEGGIIDACATTEAVIFETLRALLLIDLHAEYRYADYMIRTYYEDTSVVADSLQRILTEYDKTVTLISSNHPQPPTEEECIAYYEDCVAVFNEETAEAEVMAYKAKHAVILGKLLKDLVPTDSTALEAALEDLAAMNPAAKDKFSEGDVINLADKCAAMAVMTIAELLPTETPRGAYAPALTNVINTTRLSAYHPDALAAFAATVNGEVLKAERIAEIYDRYEEICAEDTYGGYAAEDKDALLALTESAADDIVKATAAEAVPLADVLAQKTDAAVTELNRTEAYARLHAKVAEKTDQSEDTSAAVNAVLSEAKIAIAAETDREVIRALADAAWLDIERAYVIQDMTETADEAKKTIASQGFLTKAEKDALAARVDDRLATDRAAAQAAASAEALYDGKAGNAAAVEAIVKQAEDQNKTAAIDQKAAAKQQANDARQAAVDAIRGKVYLSDEDKATLVARADALTETALEQIDQATSTAAVMAAGNALTNGLSDLTKEANTADSETEASCRRAAAEAVTQSYEAAVKDLNAMTYLTEGRRNEELGAAETIRLTFDDALAEATTPDMIATAQATAQAALEAMLAQATADNLDAAKDVSITLLMSERDKLMTLCDELKYLDDEAGAALKAEAEALFDQARQDMIVAADVATVHTIKDDTLTAMAAHEAAIQAKNDDMCVRALTPSLIVLACLLVAEAMAVAILWMIRRRRTPTVHTAAFVPIVGWPIMAMAVISPVTAWVLFCVLAVLDVALAVVIVWLIVQIVKLRVVVHKEVDGIRILDEPLRRGRKALPEPDRYARLAGPKLIYLMPPAEVMPEVVEAVTVEEADELISDEDALHCEETELEDTEVYRGRKKAEINMDVISRYFAAGETVTLNSLKQKGLLPRSVGHVKILARGRLDKPLIVIAQGFSASAVKMIVLTGGKAILTEGAPERWTWRRKRK